MAISDDFSLNYTTKKISHSTGTIRYTVNALYSWLMDLFDDAGQMDDTVPIKANTPTEYELINGWTFNADTDLGYLYQGSIKVNETDDLWANFYTLGTIEADAVVYWYQNGSLVASAPGYTTVYIDQLIKVRATGADIDTRYLTAFVRNNAVGNADLYDHFKLQAPTTGGRNPVPIATSPDTNEDGGGASVIGVTVAFGVASADVDGDGTNEDYDVTVDGNGNTCADVYTYLKYITRRENTSAVGTGTTTEGRFYLSANASYAEVKASPFGTFAGGKFFGARGIYLTNVSDPNNRVLIDATNTTKTPPVQMTVTVSAVQSGDRVLVARSSAGTINKSQFTVASRTATTVTVNEVVGADISTTGILRVGDDRYTYTGLNRGTKTFSGMTAVSEYAGGTACYVPIIDDVASSTSISSPAITYVSNFDVIARVRKKSILPFENTGTVTSAGLTVAAIRTTDTIVQ